MTRRCVFCDRVLVGLDRSTVRYYNREFAVFNDAYPSTPGHQLVIPVRHVERVDALTTDEWTGLFEVARYALADRLRESHPDGFTIGINDGRVAGQTVPHVHLHLIPRTAGDTADPRGGIRWAIRETAAYWEAVS